MSRSRKQRIARLLVGAGVLAVLGLLVHGGGKAADHRDGPIFPNTQANGRFDINDVYIFQAPGNINNTVIINTVSPFPGVLTPTTFDQTTVFRINVDNNGDNVEDITFRITFGAPNGGGIQAVTLQALPAAKFPPNGILARGLTGSNIAVRGGGMFRAANFDDPFFFDAGQFGTFAAAGMGSPVRNPGRNFFGPNGNTLGFALELPTSLLRSAPGNPNVAVWATTERGGVQVDRMGRPGINTAIIPPLPRNLLTRGERRNAFNAGHPRNDRRDFRGDMFFIINTVLQRTPADAGGLADFLLPDVLTFNTSTPFSSVPADGFPNGRRLRDDVIDVEFGLLLTAFGITSDNVGDDNGTRITDGTNGTTAAFPYIGVPNNPPAGPNP